MVTINASIKRKPLKIAICLGFAIFSNYKISCIINRLLSI